MNLLDWLSNEGYTSVDGRYRRGAEVFSATRIALAYEEATGNSSDAAVAELNKKSTAMALAKATKKDQPVAKFDDLVSLCDEHFQVHLDGTVVLTRKPEGMESLGLRIGDPIPDVSFDALLRYMYFLLGEKVAFTRDQMGGLLDLWIRNKQQVAMEDLIVSMAYDGSDADALLTTLLSGLGAPPSGIPVSVRAIKHWMWCVKRRMLTRPVKNQLFLVITGGHGVGKSQLIHRLVEEPLGFFCLRKTLQDVQEDRTIGIDSYNRGAFVFDEMAHAERTSIERLKGWVTDPKISYRPLYQNKSVTVEKRAQGIGSSNDALELIIPDYTGNRRFVPIEVRAEHNVVAWWIKDSSWAEGEDVWYRIWRGIDENSDQGYYDPDLNTDLRDLMSGRASRGIVDDFLEATYRMDQPFTVATPMTQVWRSFSVYCEKYTASGIRGTSVGSMARLDRMVSKVLRAKGVPDNGSHGADRTILLPEPRTGTKTRSLAKPKEKERPKVEAV